MKILRDLLENAYRKNENEAYDDTNINDSSDQEETATEKSQSESSDAESDSEPDHEEVIQKQSSEPCHHYQNRNVFDTAVGKTSKLFLAR